MESEKLINKASFWLKSTFSNKPQYRLYRDKGDELNKQKKYEDALELYIKSFEYSLKENDSSLTLLNRIVKTADKIGNNQITEKWINEFDKIKNTENNPEYALFGKVKILISINRISDAIIELNKLNPDNMSFYDFHLKHKYYQICYQKEKLIKTQLHHCILKRLYLLAHHNEFNEIINKQTESINIRYKELTGKERSVRSQEKEKYIGSIFFPDDKDKELVKLYNRGKFGTSYDQFKDDIDNILGRGNSFIDKIENMNQKEFHEYFKLIT